jgi:hypothetical protein
METLAWVTFSISIAALVGALVMLNVVMRDDNKHQ